MNPLSDEKKQDKEQEKTDFPPVVSEKNPHIHERSSRLL